MRFRFWASRSRRLQLLPCLASRSAQSRAFAGRRVGHGLIGRADPTVVAIVRSVRLPRVVLVLRASALRWE